MTTFMTLPILSRLIKGTGMEPDFSASEFAKQGRPGLSEKAS